MELGPAQAALPQPGALAVGGPREQLGLAVHAEEIKTRSLIHQVK